MTRHILLGLTVAGVLTACGGDERANAAAQQQYETVQEGSVAGVTTTIQGPGETLPPITGTNADTTTAFTLNPNGVAVPAQQPGLAPPAGTLGSSPAYNPSPAPTYTPPRQAETRTPQPRSQPVPQRTTTYTPPPPPPAATPERAEEPRRTEEPEPQNPPAQNTTTDVQREEPAPPPPPPPTTTDTNPLETAPPNADGDARGDSSS